MFIGKWNKSVILTYVGLAFAIFGIYLSFTNDNSLYPLSCLIVAGVCDMFDGYVARKIKRDKEEQLFGVQIDSLVDVIDFIALPIAIFINIGLNSIYHIISFIIFAICGVARLAYFNIVTADETKAIKYYQGLPVTSSAVIFPLFYLSSYIFKPYIFNILYTIIILLVSILNILNIKVIKPKGIIYPLVSILATLILILFLVVL